MNFDSQLGKKQLFLLQKYQLCIWKNWTWKTVCSAVHCKRPSKIDFGTVVLVGGSTVMGSSRMYTCNSGFSLVGVASSTCLNSGVWSDSPPTCVGKSKYVLVQQFWVKLCAYLENFVQHAHLFSKPKCMRQKSLRRSRFSVGRCDWHLKQSTPEGVSKQRPADQIRPAMPFHPAREAISSGHKDISSIIKDNTITK